jgi:hypothetical protein
MNQKFSSKKANEYLKTNSKRSRIKPGIHTGVYLEDVKVTKTVNGKPFMEFIFYKKDSNEVAPKRVWFPSEKPYIREGETEDQARQREVNENLSHILTILECYVSSDEAQIEAGSFQEFCEIAKTKLLASDYADIPVRLKLTYDADGIYTAFPKYPNYIERDIEEKPISLYFSKWELENRMTPADSITENTDSSIVVEDELPF